jgi:hypothetical protein
MAQPTDQPATDQTLDSLIGEAFGAKRMLPPYERCLHLDQALRAAIDELLPEVDERAGRAVERSREWYALRNLLDDVRETLAGDLGHGLLSAAIQVDRLAQACQRLQSETKAAY